MSVEMIVLIALIAINALFALAEMAVVTARKTRLRQLAQRSRAARAALALSESPERFLSAIQVGITLVGVLAGWIGAAPLGAMIAAPLERIDWLAEQAEEIGIVLSVGLITYATIVVGELVPKRLALAHADRMALALALPFTLFSRLAAPAVFILAGSTSLLLRLFGIRERDATSRISEEEIRLLVAESAEQGVIEPVERTMVERVLKLGDRSVESLMTPRRRIIWLDADEALSHNLEIMQRSPCSRYPVMRGSDQEIVGVLEVKQLGVKLAEQLDRHGEHAPLRLFDNLAPPLYVTEGTLALEVLTRFRDSGSSLALVVDEYGDVLGLVTPNDILGAILGQGSHALEPGESMLVRRRDGSWLVAGALPVDELLEAVALEPEQIEPGVHTVGGLVMARLGRLPAVGECFEWGQLRFEVVDLDGARIDRIIICPLPGRSTPEQA